MKRLFVLGLSLTAVSVMILGLSQNAGTQGGQWGTVKGKIIWGGKELPKQLPIAAVAGSPDKMACEMGGNVVMDERWVVNPDNKGLRSAFVWLANVDPKNKVLPIHPDLKEVKVKEVIIDQPLCAFAPHALAIRAGQELVAKNSAGIAHNFKWTGIGNPGNNVLIPPGGSFLIQGLVADRYPIKIECNIHPWMNGWVRVFDHPYYAVTDKDGSFEFKDAPAGKYSVIVWHGEGGWLGGAAGKNGKVIDIKAGGTTDVGSFEFQP